MKRLSEKTLAELPSEIQRPAYDRQACQTGIVHLGIGAFHRAHQAVYSDDVLAAGEQSWAICGASLRGPGVRDQLAPQDGLYTQAVAGPEGESLRVIGAVKEVFFAAENPAALVARLADPQTRIVSLTVTEKGYCHDPASGALQHDHPDIRHDLQHPEQPRSALGFLLAGLRRRYERGQTPFTVLSCDNLPHNGATLRGLVLELAEAVDPALMRWIEAETSFPSTMIDRIVPATTEDDRQRVSERLGLRDEGVVICEPFRQWVIEDRFAAGRPLWEQAGAQMVSDVAPFEEMKLRLLNGSHSMLAYLGYLCGHETIADTMADDTLRRLTRRFMDREAGPTLKLPPGADLESYKQALIERFANPGLQHRTWQIAMDGSQKLPQRLLATIRDRLRVGAAIDLLALAVTGWMRYTAGHDEAGAVIDVRDPLAGKLVESYAAGQGDPSRIVDAFLQLREVFDPDLADNPDLRKALTGALGLILTRGTRAAAEATLARISI
ncbi:mannitol dehydrogenase family protein [Pelagibius litoralis]|uniref:Mannitol dehydrogenase family protein n=1 Tax=Pelagibius litoralis TaxID=374515 RepID=A0A967KAR0_9PROT|nr:mannitol dehydrogenase family protein [Pelagibius litoralis]NIA71773.1 mannitol dehydrogenase family protein [Pelagibius litoralis]